MAENLLISQNVQKKISELVEPGNHLSILAVPEPQKYQHQLTTNSTTTTTRTTRTTRTKMTNQLTRRQII